MEKEKFEQLVNEGIAVIPEKFRRLLNNVAIVVEEEPTPEQKKKLHIHNGVTLFTLLKSDFNNGGCFLQSRSDPVKLDTVIHGVYTPKSYGRYPQHT